MNLFFARLPRLTPPVRRLLLTLACAGSIALSGSVAGARQSEAVTQADLTVTKSGDESAAVGGTITYTLVVINGGPDDAANVVLTDPLPAHTTFVSADSATGTVTFANNTLTVSFGTITAFESGSATLVVSVNGDTPRNTTISNTATATSSTSDPEASNNSATASTTVTGPYAGDLLISEFRLRGPGGANDEFVEIYNNNDTPYMVNAPDGSAGFALVASDGAARFVIPAGTVIPARGHYLGVNDAGYSLGTYPAGEGVAATGDASYTADIADNAGIALFRTADPAGFNLQNRLDAAGSTAESNPLYREGAGYPALSGAAYSAGINYSFYRDPCGKGGSITAGGRCPAGGLPKDTDDNAADFVFVDTNGTPAGAGQRLGAPGPENLSSPPLRDNQFSAPLLDSTVGNSLPPNRVRDMTAGDERTSSYGTLDIRRRIVNNTGSTVTRLRFRVVDVTTFPAPAGYADLRALTSEPMEVGDINDAATCSGAATPCTVTVQGTKLEEPPAQPNGGGFNSSLSADVVTLATPMQPGDSVNVRFLLGVRQTGYFRFYVAIEAITSDTSGGETLVTERVRAHTGSGKTVRVQQAVRPFVSNEAPARAETLVRPKAPVGSAAPARRRASVRSAARVRREAPARSAAPARSVKARRPRGR